VPSVDELEGRAARLERQLGQAEMVIDRYGERLNTASDLSLELRITLINQVLRKVCGASDRDASVRFLPTRNLIRETRSILGIGYTNVVDVDSGHVDLDLARFEVLDAKDGRFSVLVDIVGKGVIAVSGRYTGLPFIAAPDVSVQLRDTLSFDARKAEGDVLILTPRPATSALRIRFSRRILSWDVGYDHDIPVEVARVIPPIPVPISLHTLFDVPPTPVSGNVRIDFTLDDAAIGIWDDRILFRSDLHTRRVNDN
jgi:hypothetical protein